MGGGEGSFWIRCVCVCVLFRGAACAPHQGDRYGPAMRSLWAQYGITAGTLKQRRIMMTMRVATVRVSNANVRARIQTLPAQRAITHNAYVL